MFLKNSFLLFIFDVISETSRNPVYVKNIIFDVPKYPKYKSLKIIIDIVTNKASPVGNNMAARNTETMTVSKLL